MNRQGLQSGLDHKQKKLKKTHESLQLIEFADAAATTGPKKSFLLKI